jgi:hypothetical protein
VTEWLSTTLESGRPCGTRLLDVDYTRYADAEAVLGWVNVHANVQLKLAKNAPEIVGPLLEGLDSELTNAGISIAHLKIFDQTPSGYVKAGIVRNNEEPAPEGDLICSPERRHQIVINMRALGEPERLREFATRALAQIGGEVSIRHANAFRPSPPRPEHRFDRPAEA